MSPGHTLYFIKHLECSGRVEKLYNQSIYHPFIIYYELVPWSRTGATQTYYLNLITAWREADSASLVSLVKDRHQLGPEVPNSSISSSLLCDDRLTLVQRVDFGAMQMCSAKRDYQANSMVQIHCYCCHSVFTQLSASVNHIP